MARPKGVKDSSPTAFANRSAAHKQQWVEPEIRERMSKSLRAAWTPERRAKMSAEVRARYDDPAYREKMREIVRATCTTPEYRAALSQIRRDKAAAQRGRPIVRNAGFADLIARLVPETEAT